MYKKVTKFDECIKQYLHLNKKDTKKRKKEEKGTKLALAQLKPPTS
jgi:hypothetical protein